jgi:DNA polymerase III subunit gamma/tau
MSYQVLARKWRPRDFGSLVGQEHVVRALRHALEQKRLHHAYLFTGTRGVGKTTLARILAKCLNCETGITAEPCGKCASCVQIDGGRFPDYMELDAASNRGVDEMTQLLERAAYAPSSGRFKVYVIDEVHQLSGHAFNAMLKTLEEPPEYLKFILATTDPQKVPVTILSRCLQFNLKQMPPSSIVAHLSGVLGKETIAFEADALPVIARAAAGSMRDALSLLDQAVAYGGGKVTLESASEMLGSIDQGFLLRLLETVGAGDAAASLAIAKDMQARSLSFEAALADLAGLLLRVALAQSVPDALDDDVAERGRIVGLAAALDPETVQLFYQIALQGRVDLPLAPDEHSGFVMTLLRMLSFRPQGAVMELPRPAAADRKAPAKKEPPGQQPAAAVSRSSPGPVASAPVSVGDWPQLAQQLQVTGAARELARNAELRGRDGNIFDFAVPKSKAYLAERNYLDKLKAALEAHLGHPVTVKVSVGDVAGVTAAAIEAGDRDNRKAEAVKSVHADGFVQDLVNMFDGKVVDSTIRESDK